MWNKIDDKVSHKRGDNMANVAKLLHEQELLKSRINQMIHCWASLYIRGNIIN